MRYNSRFHLLLCASIILTTLWIINGNAFHPGTFAQSAAKVVEVGRYDLFINAKDRNTHFLVDTAKGMVWHPKLKQFGDSNGVPLQAAAQWNQVPVNPIPQVSTSVPGRFRIVTSFEDVTDTFLVNTGTGQVYGLAADIEGKFLFVKIPVEGLK